jgi:hypothetical protein
MSSLAIIDPRRAALSVDPFEPQTMSELEKFANIVSNTDFAPKEFQNKPEACFIAMLYGKSLGLGALQALQGVCVINGKPSVYGDTFWAVILSHPDFEDCQEELGKDYAGITLKRRGRSAWTGKFTFDDAKTAKLLGKAGPWTEYPVNQCLFRVRHRAASAIFADALKGILPREIAMDYIEGEPVRRMDDVAPAMMTGAQGAHAPVAAKRGDQPTPADPDATSDDRLVTKAELTIWDTERRKSGWKAVDARPLFTELGIVRAGEMRLSHLVAAMAWATSGPATLKADEAKQADQPKEAKRPSMEEHLRGAMNRLGLGMFEQDAAISDNTQNGVTDWEKLAQVIDAQMTEAGLN